MNGIRWASISRLFARIRSLSRGLRRRTDVEAEMREEFRHHLELRTEDLLRRGLSPREAARRARLEFGHLAGHEDAARAACGLHWLDAFRSSWLDFRYASRSLRKEPLPAAVAILSLGLGIGASTTMFSVIDAVDFRHLPFPDPGRLVWLTEVTSLRFPGCVRCPDFISLANAVDWRSQTTSYEGMAFQGHDGVYVEAAGMSNGIDVGLASPGFFRLLGERLALGRDFFPEDTAAGVRGVAILSHAMWMARFDGDPAVLGSELEYFDDVTLRERHTSTIVGVLPPGACGRASSGVHGATSTGRVPVPPGAAARGRRPSSPRSPCAANEASQSGGSTRCWRVFVHARRAPG